jgi:hypothetical protein
MNSDRSVLTRRSTVGFLLALGLGGAGVGDERAWAKVKTSHVLETRAVGFEWMIYTDAAGNELAQMRPYAMQDISHEPNVETPEGTRSLGMSVKIWNTGDAELTVPPSAFALWGADGMLFRPQDIYLDATPDNQAQAMRAFDHSAAPIPPSSERFGWLHFRVPTDACLAGLLFTPEPERVLVVADFSIPSTVIVD